MDMKPLEQIYWLRVGLGIVAGMASTGLNVLVGSLNWESFVLNELIYGIDMALIIYLASYFIMKAKFKDKLEKPKKLMTMGIFIYFIAWLVVWILFYSILRGPPPA